MRIHFMWALTFHVNWGIRLEISAEIYIKWLFEQLFYLYSLNAKSKLTQTAKDTKFV